MARAGDLIIVRPPFGDATQMSAHRRQRGKPLGRAHDIDLLLTQKAYGIDGVIFRHTHMETRRRFKQDVWRNEIKTHNGSPDPGDAECRSGDSVQELAPPNGGRGPLGEVCRAGRWFWRIIHGY